MFLKSVKFVALLFTGLALAPTFAHLLELYNKIDLPRDEYFSVQQIYRGWALLGFVVFGALLSNLTLAVIVRHRRKAFVWAVVAFLCIAGTQIVFWMWTYPANQQTTNWTEIPEDWAQLRSQWEYSQAASAVLNLVAYCALVVSVLTDNERTAVEPVS